jgi:hypothetical protein
MNIQKTKIRIACISVFWSVTSSLIILFIAFFKNSLELPTLLISCTLGIALSLFNAPFILPHKIDTYIWQNLWRPPLLCAFFLVWPVFGLVLGSGWLLVLLPVGVYGLWRAFRIITAIPPTHRVIVRILGGLAIACLLAVYIIASGDWLFVPEKATIGVLLPDLYYHFALTEMLHLHSTISFGVHGLAPLKYHFGSHLWFAAVGMLVENGISYAYAFGMLIVLIPVMFFSLCIVAASFSSDQNLSDERFTSLMIFVVSGTILLDSIGWHSYYISPSHTISLSLFILAFPFLNAGHIKEARAYFVFVLTYIILLSMVKVSAGMLWAGGCCIMILRGKLAPRNKLVYILISVIITGLCVMAFISPAQQTVDRSLSLELLHFYRIYGNIYSLSSLIPAAILVIPTLFTIFNKSFFIQNTDSTCLKFPIELALFISILSMIPGSIVPIAGGSAWYFINLSQWICLLLLGVYFVSNFDVTTLIGQLQKYLAVLALVLALDILLSAARPNYLAFLRELPSTPSTDLSLPLNKFLANNWRKNGTFVPTDFNARIKNNTVSQLITKLQTEPTSEFLVYISPDVDWFWKAPGDCMSKSFLIPAMTGHPFIYGLPPDKACVTDYYDQSVLGMRSRFVGKTELCAEANKLGFHAIAIVDSKSPSNALTMLRCSLS